MAFEIFGFEIQSKKDKKAKTFVTPENTDGATTVVVLLWFTVLMWL